MASTILLVDDSALMRSVLGDMINRDKRFHVEDKAKDGLEALELLRTKKYGAVVLDINMPKMSGMELLKTLRREGIKVRVLVCSTDTPEGSKTAMDALEAGAIDCVHKPEQASKARSDEFVTLFLETLAGVCAVGESGYQAVTASESARDSAMRAVRQMAEDMGVRKPKVAGRKLVAIASSTGGPKSLQSVIPKLPANLASPVVLVQHMPTGFTTSLAERLNAMSRIEVREGREGEALEAGKVYIAKGGRHMVILHQGGRHTIHYKDLPPRENVRPCANYMYESLTDSGFDEVVCVVMTGMGTDGEEGIKNLKKQKRVYVISQNADTCIVYGMPRAVEGAGLSDKVLPLGDIAGEIVESIGTE